MKRHSYTVVLTAILLLLSGFGYFVHYLVFRDVHHIALYLIGDLAFVPLEVLLVVVVIERTLIRRETQAKLQKLNMVAGAFFSEAGDYLLQSLLESFRNKEEISRHLNVTAAWTKKDFQKAADFADYLPVDVDY